MNHLITPDSTNDPARLRPIRSYLSPVQLNPRGLRMGIRFNVRLICNVNSTHSKV